VKVDVVVGWYSQGFTPSEALTWNILDIFEQMNIITPFDEKRSEWDVIGYSIEKLEDKLDIQF